MAEVTVNVCEALAMSIPPGDAPRVMGRAVLVLLVTRRVPPFRVTPAAAAPRLASLLTDIVPPLTVVPPVNVFVPPSTSVPAPALVKAPAPVMVVPSVKAKVVEKVVMSRVPPEDPRVRPRLVVVKAVPVTRRVPLFSVTPPEEFPRLASLLTDNTPPLTVVPPV
jgi:hypothetical protein